MSIYKKTTLRLLPLCLGMVTQVSLGQEASTESSLSRPYFFSSGCASQGAWTQQALNSTNQIRDIVKTLEKDPNCSATSGAIQGALNKIEVQLAESQLQSQGSQSNGGLISLPGEIAALRSFIGRGSEVPKEGLLQLMMKKTIEYAKLSSQNQMDKGDSAPDVRNGTKTSSALESLGNRIQKSSSQSLDLFNTVLESVSQNSQCLTGAQQGQFLSAAVSTLSSFASSGQGQVGNKMALAVSKLTAMGKKMKHGEIYKQLNKIEFMNSMSCLVELTSESYCSTHDAEVIRQEMTEEKRKEVAESGTKYTSDPNHPLSGYYLLTQQLPLIANWLQKVQIGADPKLMSDANFKNSVLQKVNDFFMVVNQLQGVYNEKLQYIQNLEGDPKTQKLAIIELINILTNGLAGGNAGQISSEFFTMTYSMFDMPFRLIGIDTTPSKIYSSNQYNFSLWINESSNYDGIPGSANPVAFAQSIGRNLDKIIESSRASALKYYNTWFIVDKMNIYLDTFQGVKYNVIDGLLAVDKYLENLQARVAASRDYKGVEPSIIEIRAKIGSIWKQFKKVEELNIIAADTLRTAPRIITKDYIKQIKDAHAKFLTETYDQFDVLLARSGYLSNRLARYVELDFQMRLIEGGKFDRYLKDLYYASGNSAFTRILLTAGTSPADLQSDLASALNANKANLSALELMFRENFAGMIIEQNLIASQTEKAKTQCAPLIPADIKSKTQKEQLKVAQKVKLCWDKFFITPGTIYWNQHLQSFKQGYDTMGSDQTNKLVNIFNGLKTSVNELFVKPIIGSGYQGRYDLPNFARIIMNNGREKTSFDTEFGSSKYIAARMCVQALAFNDLDSIWSLCKGKVLESDFQIPLEQTQFRGVDSEYFKVVFQKKAYEDIDKGPGANQSKRICAFRDYFRRNQVLYLTMENPRIANQNKPAIVPGYAIEPAKEVVEQPAPGIVVADEEPKATAPAKPASGPGRPARPVKKTSKPPAEAEVTF